MLRLAIAVVLSLGLGLDALAAGDPCPDRIQYQGGNLLKNGTTYYYATGSLLTRSGTIYYPDGGLLKREGIIYYPGGSLLQRDANLFYPNGGYLKRDGNYFYANGAYLKRDANFFYSSGSYARRNGKLYRPDGSETAFPVYLHETIPQYGTVDAEVHASKEYVDVTFRDLLVNTHGVHLLAPWNGASFAQFEFTINTGVPGEDVLVTVKGNDVSCFLGAGPNEPPTHFTVVGKAGTAQLQLFPGFDHKRILQGVERLLDTGGARR